MKQEICLGKYSRKCVICGKDYRVNEGEIYGNDHCTSEEQVCLSCAEFKELEFIRQTLIDKPSLNVSTLSKETKIPTSRILRYIKEEHIIPRKS